MAIKPNRQSTTKQKESVKFCEEILSIEFEGNINKYVDCYNFLNIYLEDAKRIYDELKGEWETAMLEYWD